MGTKGDKLTGKAADFCERVVGRLAPLGDVTSKKMFGGFGIFESGAMFALVDSQARLFLKADDSNRERFEAAGSERHGPMPYFSLPEGVLADDGALLEWAKVSQAAAIAAKKK